MNKLIEIIDRWQTKRIVVVGDFMLDHMVYGNAERLSPDAPVPVLSVEREDFIPGGASNVCMDLVALKCEVTCLGVVGSDTSANKLMSRLSKAGCDTNGLITADDRPTTVKRSYVGLAQHRHPQKMFRADFEKRGPIDESTRRCLIDVAAELLEGAAVLCIEDYNKGVITAELCAELIELAKHHGVEVLVDPAAIDDYTKYRGVTAITPNRTEAELATGLPTHTQAKLDTVAEQLMNDLDLDVVVLTLDKQGALLRERDGKSVAVPTLARSVYDVTGAGDMVLAMLAAARANGASWRDAVELANAAAGLEVERFGCVPIPLEDVHFALLQQHHAELGKVRKLDQLLPELAAYRKQGRRVAFTNGCFDILHAGHVELLRGARAQGDLLVLAVNSDLSIQALKGPKRPICPEADRLRVLSALESVDYLITFGTGEGGEADTPIPLLRAIQPDVLVKGGTYSHDEVVGWEVVEAYGGRVVTIPPVEGLSTTNIVEKIKAQR
ncbi:MAG: adenylyltransferase/cytidyltransferase family protein [Phycisphaera sp.]|nr:adenylyltransferase/cytidyltransferase family protein [Phycisphaera sp.]